VRAAALIWDDVLATYRFHPEHPLNPRRLELTVDLIRRLGLVGDEARPWLAPRAATDAEVATVHAPEYIAAVKRASVTDSPNAELLQYGLGTGDVPLVPRMHEASLVIVGATLTAAEAVMSGRVQRAFQPAGGLHHARRAEASGFCVYNDLAVAIRWLQQHGARVMYIDFDVHHGDGVQWIFYEDPGVLTVSFHESGAYLYPGTGFVEEMGEGDGYGTSVNVPLEPFTEDASFLRAFAGLVPELASAFHPDVIVMQCGCDAHVLDPLADLRCTTALYEQLTRVVSDVADRHCQGRIIATGGGGYAVHAVVPRAWTLVWCTLCGIEAPDVLPDDWVDAVERESGRDVPRVLRDPPGAFPPSPRRTIVEEMNERTVARVRREILPHIRGWGLTF
jgi:acetoin utilization protein AcuC